MNDFLFLSLPGGTEWIILVVIGLLLFGRKLPTIARSLGQSVVEFKKGIKGVQDDVEKASSSQKQLSDSNISSEEENKNNKENTRDVDVQIKES